jgi:hypothetical protein
VAVLTFSRAFARFCFLVAGANLIALAIVGQYDIRFGPVHLAATYLFKPLLYVNSAFLLALVLSYRRGLTPDAESPQAGSLWPDRRFWIAAVGLVAAMYLISFRINLDFLDWTHRATTSHVSPWSFFTHRQYDGFYRPLTFVSLWLDDRVFGPNLWGYHIQNVVIHLVNGFLIARLAFKLGLNPTAAQWSGLAFLAVPASFEAVIWPGARFDLMSGAFVFFSLERALSGAVWMSTAAFAVGVLCKETAYAYPLLLVALFLVRRPLRLALPQRKWMAMIVAAFAATAVVVAVRIGVYGNLGGYPDVVNGGNGNFVFGPRTVTSVFTRLPAALFLINSGAGLPAWLRACVIAYVALLAVLLFQGISAGRWTLLIVMSFIAVIPIANMFGWMTQFAQQGRYLYQPVIWIVFAIAAGISVLRGEAVLMACWTTVMAVAALFNTLAYVKMLSAVPGAVAQAAGACGEAPCGRMLCWQMFRATCTVLSTSRPR